MTRASTECDVCPPGTRRKVRRFRIAQDGDLVAVDLCREHSEYLDTLIKLGERVPASSPKVRVWDIEEIEAEKKRLNAKTTPRPGGRGVAAGKGKGE